MILSSCQWPFEPSTDDDNIILDYTVSSGGVSIDTYVNVNGNNINVFWEVYGQTYPLPIGSEPIEFNPAYVEIYLSETGHKKGYREIYHVNYESTDTLELSDLEKDKIYYLRLGLKDSSNSLICLTKPVMFQKPNSLTEYCSFDVSLKEHPLYHVNLDWAPDGSKIAVVKKDNAGFSNIHTLSMTNRSFNKITDYNSSDYRLMSISFSPDGNKICYTYSPSSTFASIDYKIWKVNLSTSTKTALSQGRVDSNPFWYDQGHILFCNGTYEAPNIPELTILNVNDGSETAITSDQEIYKYFPVVSSTSDQVIYTGYNSVREYLYKTDLQGSQSTRLTDLDYWRELHPSYVQNTNEVYFSSSRCGHYEIWSVNLNNGALKQVTFNDEPDTDTYYGIVNSTGEYMAVIKRYDDNSYKLIIYNH